PSRRTGRWLRVPVGKSSRTNDLEPVMQRAKAWIGRPTLFGLACFMAAIGLSSCGPSGPKVVPVQGKVTLTDGTPISYGHVIIHADESKGNTSKEVSQGTITDGTYRSEEHTS